MPAVHARRRVAASAAVVLVALALGGCRPERLGEPDTPTPELLPRPTSIDDPVFPDVGRLDLDVTHYDLDLTWDTASQVLTGVAEIDLMSHIDTPSLSLDFSGALRVTSATLDGRQLRFVREGDTLLFDRSATQAGEPHTLVVEYRGTPEPAEFPGTRKDIPALGWTIEEDGQVWTMQEPYGAFTWYPVNDHPSDKATYDLTITVEGSADFVAVAGGDPVQLPEPGAGATTSEFQLRQPTASYLTTIAIGPYERFTEIAPTGPTPLSYWVAPGSRQESILRSLQTSPALLSQLTEQLGPLPFGHLGAVVVPADSAMETQELVTMGAPLFRQPAQMAIPVLAHEYAHQWYGNTVTPLTWDDLWLNEGFAMYLELEFRIGGDAAARDGVHTWLAERDQRMRDKFGPPGDYDEDQFASSNVYLSGALTLYELRERVGDEMFAELLRDWPQEHHGMNATTEDYIAWVNHTTGEDLTAFFDEWLTSPTTPEGAGPDA